MNDVTLPGLIVPVEARISALEKGLQRANRSQRQAAQKMERRAKVSADRMTASYARAGNAAAAAFKRVALPLASVAALTGLTRGARSAISSLSDLAKVADRVGVGVENLQALQHGFELAGVSSENMSKSLENFARRVGEASAGGGELQKWLTEFNIEIADGTGQLRSQEEILRDIANVIQRIPNAQRRLAVANAAFGESGRAMVNALSDGAGGIDRMIAAAKEGGFVLEEDLVRKAEELDDRFAELTKRVSVFGKHLAVEIADGVAGVIGLKESIDDLFANEAQGRAILGDQVYDALDQNAAALKENKREVIDLRETYAELFREVNAMTGPTGIRVFDIDNEDAKFALADILSGIDDVTRKFNSGQITAEEFTTEMTALAAEADEVRSELENIDGAGFSNAITGIGNLTAGIREAVNEAVKLRNELPSGYVSSGRGDGNAEAEARRRQDNGQATPQAVTTSLRPPSDPRGIDSDLPAEPRAGRSGGAGRTADDYTRTAQAIRDETRALEAEALALAGVALVGRDMAVAIEQARREAELLNAAQRQGITITPAVREEIRQTANAHAEAASAMDAAEARLDQFEAAKQQIAATGARAFEGLITGALDFRSALQMVLADMARMVAQQLIMQTLMGALGGATGGGAGLIGGLLGFSGGGYTGPGGKFEPAGVVHKGEYVMSKAATSRIGVSNLEALHSAAKRGYSGGGLVGGTGPMRSPSRGSSESQAAAQPITINAPVTVNASGGTPEQNGDLAKKVSHEMEMTMRGVVCDELRRQMRPGNMISKR